MPTVGIDFDNTIVCYDSVFHDAARERGWIPAELPANKESVRDHLRATQREALWTELQGFVYGQHIAHAAPFPDVEQFFAACREAGIRLTIISHKTRTPYRGPQFDLRQAATAWLESHAFLQPSAHGVPRDLVFFEDSKEAKLQRIQRCHCDAFVDDLPEFLADRAFPSGVRKIHFDPAQRGSADAEVFTCHSWSSVLRRTLDWFAR